MDVDVVEHALVQLPALLVGSVEVVGLSVSEQGAEVVELLDDELAARRVTLDLGLRRGTRGRDPGLLLLQLVDPEGVGVERLEEPVALPVQFKEVPLRLGLCRFLSGQQRADVLEDDATDVRDLRGGHGDKRPPVLNERFKDVRLHGLEGAAVLQPLTAEAVEVVVEVALAVAGLLESQRLTAVAAVDGALEVVRVDPRLLLALLAGSADALRLREKRLIDERLMVARVLNALEADDADVVAVLENVVDMRVRDRRARTVGVRERHHPTLVEFLTDHRDGPLAAGVALEDPRHPVATIGVDDHGLNLAPIVESLAAVEVAERRRVDGAAAFRLLQHPLARLGREVPAVELGDRTHDPVQQHAARGLIDVLGAADELSTGLRQPEVDLDVVDAVASETVDLVNDDSVDAVLFDVGEHALEFGSVGRPGTLTGIDELVHDLKPQGVGFAQAGFALSRDGEALGFATAVRLIFGRNAAVNDGEGLADTGSGDRGDAHANDFQLRWLA